MNMPKLWRYWGYVLIVILAALWLNRVAGSSLLIFLSGVATLYFLFQAPVWCGATTRGDQLCRNNAYGALLGCHLRQHKWQKIKMTFVPSLWRRLNRGLWSSPTTGLATIGAVLSILSTLAAAGTKIIELI